MSTFTLVLALASAAAMSAAPARPDVRAVVERAGRWAAQFERDFTTVIADEVYDQVVERSNTPGVRRRRIRSELLFVRNERGDAWSSVRNVLSYQDGEKNPSVDVPNSGDRLTRALETPAGGRLSALRRLADESARFNIGTIQRNFNTPTLAMQFVDEMHRWRFKFRVEESDVVAGEATWPLSYREREHPTLIRANLRDTELSGRIWTRASDGAIVRTRMDLAAKPNGPYGALSTTVTVDYQQDAKLGMLAPIHMEEEYRDASGNEQISGTAVYSNYRVFETSARVISPQ